MRYFSGIALLLLVFSSCVKDKPDHPVQPSVQLTGAQKVYIINEGPFQGGGNGSISLYDTGSEDVIENFYEAQNNLQLGNVVQSLNRIHGNYYVVVNNSNKIVVCNNQFRKIGQINDLMSPRYIVPVTNQKAYVSDLYANAVSIVDLNSNVKTGSIACAGKTEKMVLIYNKVFITNLDREYVYVVNTLSDAITDSVFVGSNAGSIVIDKHDRVWVLGAGNAPVSKGRLTKINPLNNQVEMTLEFSGNELPGNLCLNKTRDTLFYINNHIFRMPVSDVNLPSTYFIEKGTKNFYGLGVNPNDYRIYTADALDYSQRSQIYIYNADGSLKTNFKAGMISNGFYFE